MEKPPLVNVLADNTTPDGNAIYRDAVKCNDNPRGRILANFKSCQP
jgi:hypothetical protein